MPPTPQATVYNKEMVEAYALRQIREDVEFGNTTQLEELLSSCPTGALLDYLSEERLKALVLEGGIAYAAREERTSGAQEVPGDFRDS